MEEILASIRRIISEDEAPAGAGADAAPEEASEAAAMADHAEPAPADDVLELTDMAPPAGAPEPIPGLQALGDLDVSERAEPAPPRAAASPPPAPAQAPAPPSPPMAAPMAAEEPLVSADVVEAAASHFGQLAQSIAMPAHGRTLEDVVRELLRPMLKGWLDEHLPKIVEARVQAEVERVSRGRGY